MENQQGQQQLPQSAPPNNTPVVDNSTGESRAMKVLRRVQGVPVPDAIPTPPITPPADPKPVVNAPVTPPVEAKQGETLDLNIDIEGTPAAEPRPDTTPVINDDEIDLLNEPKGENFMKLRKKLKATVNVRKELETEVETLRKKVTDYETGLVAPEETERLRTRVSELEPYEQIHNFKASPAYRTQFAEPLAAAKDKFDQLAMSYNVQPEEIENLLAIDNQSDLNRAISNYFPDNLSALEVKESLKRIKSIRDAASAAEKNPAAIAAELEQRHQAAEAYKKSKNNELTANTAKTAWVQSLLKAREDQEFPELSFVEGNTKHNEEVARPLLQRSAAEYSKLVKDITTSIHAGTPLPPEVSYALANMVQRAYAATVAATERQQLKEELARVRGTMARNNAMDRPGANGMNIGGAGGAPVVEGREGGAKGAARRVLARVQGQS